MAIGLNSSQLKKGEKITHESEEELQGRLAATCKGDGAVNGEDPSLTPLVTELAVWVTGKDLSTVAAEELDGGDGQMALGRFDHHALHRVTSQE